MSAREAIPPAPPRDALLKDRRGEVWASLGVGDEWVRLAGVGPAPVAAWPELVTVLGPVDVMVWRGNIAVPLSGAEGRASA